MALDESTLIAKIVVGITAVGASGGAGVYAYQSGFFTKSFSDEKFEDFLVVAVHKPLTESNKPSKKLYETTPTVSKNFKCFVKTKENKEGSNCDIFKITSPDESKKIFNLEDFNKKDLKKVENIDTPKTGDLFKLKIDTSKLKTEIKYDDSDGYTINLKNITAGEETTTRPSYGTLKILAKISDNEVTTDYKKIIVKTTSNNIDSSTADYKCNVGGTGDDNKLNCKIYKFTPDVTADTGITFEKALTEVTDAQSSNVKENNFYVIDFSSEKAKEKLNQLTLENLKKTIIYQGSETDKKAEFSLKKLFIGTDVITSTENVFLFNSHLKNS